MSSEENQRQNPQQNTRPNVSASDTIPVESDDGYTYYCSIESLQVSRVLRTLIAANSMADPQPLAIPGIKHDILVRVFWWMENHKEDRHLDDNSIIDTAMNAWDRCFFDTTLDTILGLIKAANYLDIKRMYSMAMNRMAEVIDEKLNDPNPVQSIRDGLHMSHHSDDPTDKENESIHQLFVFPESGARKAGHHKSKIDALDVQVVHLPPRKLERPNPSLKD